MARLIPLYSDSSQAEIEKRARRLFEQNEPKPSGYLDCWLQAETDYLEHLRQTPSPAMLGVQLHMQHQIQSRTI